MPGFNGTGPMGKGPQTGGGRGFCSPDIRAFFGSAGRRGASRGMGPCGGGRGRLFGGGHGRQRFGTAGDQASSAPISNEIENLKHQAGILESELAALHKRIEELGGRKV